MMPNVLKLAPLMALLVGATGAQAQAPAAASASSQGQPQQGGRPMIGPVQKEHYRSSLVKLGDGVADGLFYEPVGPVANPDVAVLYFNSSFNFDPPAAELATRGTRALFVRNPSRTSGLSSASPLDGFKEISHGIAYLHNAGIKKVVIAGWGGGAVTAVLYADVAAHGPAACQQKELIYPCKTEEATGFAKPDGIVLFDPGLGSGSKLQNVNPVVVDGKRRADLDLFSAANGFDVATGTAKYSPDFRRRYFAAQSARNNEVIDQALARLKALDQSKGTSADEPMVTAGIANISDGGGLHRGDVTLMSHTKKPHTLLKADGSKPEVILRSIRPTSAPVGAEALQKDMNAVPQAARDNYSLRQFLANDAIRTTKDFAVTEDDVIGVDWKTSGTGTPYQAEGIAVPALVMTNTCFQFVVASEIVYDHLASKDKTLAGVEGSEHFFTPCGAQYGDTQKRLFDYVSGWLGKAGRF